MEVESGGVVEVEVPEPKSSPHESLWSTRQIDEIYREYGKSMSVDPTQSPTIASLADISNTLQSTQLLGSTQCSLSPSFSLSFLDINTIRQHLTANGKLNESKKMSLAWLTDNISILTSLTPQSGSHLEHVLGKEYIFVKDALMALDLLSAHGTITPTELAMSEDARVLAQAHPLDRLTFHSLANVIRNIYKERSEL